LAIGGILIAGRIPLRADAPTQVNFQARLTQANGQPILDGPVALVTFRLFSDPALVQSAFLWGEAHANVIASRGIISVRLGNGSMTVNADGSTSPASNPLNPALFSDGIKYMQVQVNSDPPLKPAIAMVSVPYALSASSLNGQTPDQLVPIGTIVEWYRADFATHPPANWAICDGHVVNDSASPFNGKAVPNLVNKFSRAVDSSVLTGSTYGSGNGSASYPVGGSDSQSLPLGHTHGFANHTHTVPPHAHTYSGNTSYPVGFQVMNLPEGISLYIAGPYDHYHSYSGTTDNSPTLTTSGATGSTDSALGSVGVTTVPAYVGLLKIIRIK
jgi:hypothetical protein